MSACISNNTLQWAINFKISTMGAIHKMAAVRVCEALLYTGACWMYCWLRAAKKNSPSESYFLLLLLEYASGDTYRRSLCSKNLKNQATERVRARYIHFFRSMTESSVGLRTTVQHRRAACIVTRTAVGSSKRHLRLGFVFPTEKGSTPSVLAVLFFVCDYWLLSPLPPPRDCQIWLIRYGSVQR